MIIICIRIDLTGIASRGMVDGMVGGSWQYREVRGI
jgi:hypothetical protein